MARTKKNVKVVSVEEQLARSYNNAKESIAFSSTPTYVLNVGDKVSIGHLEDATIEEVLDDGMIYKISYNAIKTDDYGRRTDERYRQTDFFPWYRVRPFSQRTESSLIRVDNDMKLSYSQRVLSGFFSMHYFFGVEYGAEYQRDHVWTMEDKVSLIDSIFHGVDIGKFVFVKNDFVSGEPDFEILDGKQRLTAIIEFYENKFPYKGFYFNDLSARERDFFENYTVNYAEVDNMSRADRLRLFILLNTSGRVVEQNQIEKAKKIYKTVTGEDFS